jgi:hypothetical protein
MRGNARVSESSVSHPAQLARKARRMPVSGAKTSSLSPRSLLTKRSELLGVVFDERNQNGSLKR